MNGILVVDKPKGPTSHDVVAKARRAFNTRAVGHAGTLDPMATGVLVLAIGQGTKLVQYLTADDKTYEAEILLGSITDTLDAEGVTTEEAAIPEGLTLERVREAAASFLGPHEQRAPRVSAIKVGGRPLHERVRRGETVEAPMRPVVLHSIDIESFDGEKIRLRLSSGKGFYVRSLARDLAERLGTLGHLVALRRVKSGRFGLEEAVSWEELLDPEPAARTSLHERALSLEEAAAIFEKVALSEAGAEEVRHGRRFDAAGLDGGRLPETGEDETLAFMHPDGTLMALGRREGELLRVVRGFPREPSNSEGEG